MDQLGRILLCPSSGSPDEQPARPDDRGSYGELMEAIDRILEDSTDPSAEDGSRSID